MKFRHTRGVRLALTTGHVTTVGPAWRELPEQFHQKALEMGCIVDQEIIPERHVVVPKPSADAVVGTDDGSIIRRALIKMIERNSTEDPDDFTAAGMPNLNTLRKECGGMEINRELAYRIYGELQAEAEAAAAALGDGADKKGE